MNFFDIHAPAGGFAPGQVAQPVGPVVEALFEHLLVQARAVEARAASKVDIALERVVDGRGPDAVRVEALVEHQAQVERLVVEKDLAVFDVDLAQPGIAVDQVIEHGPGFVQHIQVQIVEERRSGDQGLGWETGRMTGTPLTAWTVARLTALLPSRRVARKVSPRLTA